MDPHPAARPDLRRSLISRILLAAAAAIALFLTAAGLPDRLIEETDYPTLRAAALEQNQRVLQRATAAFAGAKAINAVLSMLGTTQVTGSVPFVGGVGGAVTPGSALEPIDDLVEQFATVMLVVAAIAAGTDLVIRLGDVWGFSPILPAALACLALAAALGIGRLTRLRAAAARLGWALLVLAFVLKLGLPLAVAGTGQISDTVIEPAFEASSASLERWEERTAEAGTVIPPAPEADSWWPKPLRDLFRSIGRNIEQVDIDALMRGFDGLFQDLAKLITVFLLQTVVLPTVLLLVLLRGVRILLGTLSPGLPRR